jgi:hypothetical protein
MGEYGFDVKEIDIVTLCCCLAYCGPEFIEGRLYWYPTTELRHSRVESNSLLFKPKIKGKLNKHQDMLLVTHT